MDIYIGFSEKLYEQQENTNKNVLTKKSFRGIVADVRG